MDYRKEAKESRTKKLHQLTVSAPDEKVGASDFTPYPNPKLGEKTGKRPINPRAFKRGGKVAALEGGKAAKRGDRMGAKGRKAKQVGGEISAEDKAKLAEMAGAAAKEKTQAPRAANVPLPPRRPEAKPEFRAKEDIQSPYKKGGRTKKMMGGDITAGGNPQIPSGRGGTSLLRKAVGLDYKKGGKVKKMNGGPMMAAAPANLMKRKTPLNNPAAKAPAVMPMRAKGGKVGHEDEAMDKALIKKMVKPEARKCSGGRTKKADGGAKMRSEYTQLAKADREARDRQQDRFDADDREGKNFDITNPERLNKEQFLYVRNKDVRTKEDDANQKQARARIEGGYIGDYGGMRANYRDAEGNARAKERLDQAPVGFDKDDGRKRGGRTKRASGGRAKGKSNINIVIAPQPAAQGGMPPMGMPPRPMMPPPPMPAPGGMPPGGMPPGAMGGAMPIPVPMPMGGAGGAPAPQGAGVPGLPGMAPLPRKSGGRIRSYKDMTAGAGSGEGRLQKEEMAEYKRVGRKAGGSVPNMTAGAGSGPGRIEKIHAYGENPHGEAAPKPQKRKIV